ncbi:MAG TPA: glycosyltransferase family 4 protein [Thermoanaerobaculia bacterium]|jgi:glycosyltransferase involved in cell wall biosynthesis
MKILHLAAGNRWTGAAAPAFAEVEALRAAGIDAHYAYVGGYKLEAKLARHEFAHPVIAKAQNPISFLKTTKALERLVALHGFEVVHAHLTYDHWLARFVARGHPHLRIARTFHSRRTLRNEPFTRSLLSATDAIFVTNEDLVRKPLLRDREVTFTPPPLDVGQFSIDGPDVRSRYGISPTTPVIMAIGKVSKHRGFEAIIETFARVRTTIADAKLLLIGHGEHRPLLEALIRSLSIADSVIWAGYHEDDLAEHYRSSDVLLFTAAGSDEGHRAILEAMGCGVAPATWPIEGMPAILGELSERHIAPSSTPDALAMTTVNLLRRSRTDLRVEVNGRAQVFSYGKAARRLINAYSTAL